MTTQPILATDPVKPAPIATLTPAHVTPPVQKPDANKASVTK